MTGELTAVKVAKIRKHYVNAIKLEWGILQSQKLVRSTSKLTQRNVMGHRPRRLLRPQRSDGARAETSAKNKCARMHLRMVGCEYKATRMIGLYIKVR